MSFKQPLPDEQEQQAQELAARIRDRVDEDVVAMARLLVSKREEEIFGDTEFEVRDIVLRIGAQAYEEHLKKRSGAKGTASNVRRAANPPSTTATGGDDC